MKENTRVFQGNKIFKSGMIKSLLGVVAVFSLAMIFSNSAFAAGKRTLPVDMEVVQSDCRSMLDMVNDFRTGPDAWQYNKSGQKEYITAGNLTYDYNLEQIATQRAYEIAISFDHTRPNGESCFTCTYNGTSSYGENIAAGYETAEEVYIAWREDNDDYSGQGHRRNMLNPDYTAIGIGHVRYQGYDFWAQEFGFTNSGAPYQAPVDGTVTATVEINTDFATLVLAPTTNYISDKYGNSGDMPGINGYYEMSDTWGAKGLPVPDSELSSIQWASEDTAIVTASGGGYTVVGNGSTKLTGSAVFEGNRYSCSVSFYGQKRYMTDEEISVTVPNADFLPNGAEPKPVLTLNGMTLTEGVDYTLSYYGNKTPGTGARVYISGTGNFQSSRTEYFEVYAVDINNCELDPIADMTYTGNAIRPSITGTLGGQSITYNHYSISSIENNTDVGTATVVYQGRNGLTGTKEMTFQIVPRPLSDCTLSPIASKPYTGSEIIPSVSIRYNRTLTSSDYTVTCTNNVNIGTANVTITGKGNYTGSIQSTFEITKVPMSYVSYSGTTYIQYTGEAVKPTLTFTYGSFVLEEGKDFTIGYSDNVNVGKATATLTGKGIYEGTKSIQFSIYAKSINTCNITTDSMNQYYTGSAICPGVTIMHGTKKLVQGSDYTVTYGNNVNVTSGGATMMLQGTGNYNGTITYRFNILRASIENFTIEAISDQPYSGSAVKPDIVLKSDYRTLTAGTDYTLSYSANTNVGTATVTATGIGNYTGSKKATFKIVPKNISGATIAAISNQTYTGSALTPALTVTDGSKTLVKDTDYSVSYSNNINVGTATVTITGKGNYTGSKKATFKIKAKSVSELSYGSIAAQTYTGSEIKPAVTVTNGSITLKSGTDYTLSYSGNINAGTATVTVTGKGNYTGSRDVTFTIKPKSVSGVTIQAIESLTYTGSAQTPALSVADGTKGLVAGTDYTVAYSNNVNAGTAKATLTGKGNYTGSKSVTFTINAKPLTSSDIKITVTSKYTYTGSAILPNTTVKDGSKTLTKGTDYKVSGNNNVSVGKATVVITGTGNYSGKYEGKFTIQAKSIADLTVGEIEPQIYTGSELKPDVTMMYNGKKLTKETDYTLSYENNINLGVATVNITGTGNYSGSNSTTFVIQKRRVYDVFSDVKKGQWYVNALQYVYDYDIMGGKTATLFGTSDPISREQFTQVLYNHSGKPEVTSQNPYADVKTGAWYAKSVIWAKEKNIANGKTKGGVLVFGVGDPITREEMALMLYKYAQLNHYDLSMDDTAIQGYSDTGKVSSWAKNAMNWAISQGIMSGKGSADADKSKKSLDPAGKATRAECASMVMKMLEKNTN